MPRLSTIASAHPASAAATLIGIHAAVWTVLPTILEGSIRLDVAEHVMQGREWLLAYPKQPPFSMWLVAMASEFGPARYAAVYLLGQLLAVTGLIAAAWVLRPKGAAVVTLAVLIGLATPFLTYVPIQVNHNIGVMPFWGLALAAGFAAFESARLRNWLLFGAAVGLGMWAKYSILHLAVPLAVAFFAVPQWRRQVATPGPWLAGVLAVAIAAPHITAVLQAPAPLAYATRTFSTGLRDNVLMCGGFLLMSAALLALMGMMAAAATGIAPLRRAIVRSFSDTRGDRIALYLHVALFGPIAVIAVAALMFGVRPRFLWFTPIALSGAVWWAHKAAQVLEHLPARAFKFTAAFCALFATSYVAVRLAAPLTSILPSYADFDGPALARLAERQWRTVGGPIPYVVSFGTQRGRQIAGSIMFDTADRPHAFEDASVARSPWIDVADVVRRGALVVAPRPLTADDRVAGRPVENVVQFERPTVRAHFRRPRPVYFGIVRPAGR